MIGSDDDDDDPTFHYNYFPTKYFFLSVAVKAKEIHVTGCGGP
jgi:hypothetical protein